MATKAGVILSKVEDGETKYCVVVQRFYPQIADIEVDVGDITITNADIVNGLKIFVRGKDDGPNRFPPHPDLYFKLPDSGSRSNPIFDFKIGFPKGGMEGSELLKKTAQRELEEETGIKLNDNKFDDERTLEIRRVKYYKCVLSDSPTDGEVVPDSPEPKDNHKHEIHSVHFFTLSELQYLTDCFKNHISGGTQNVIDNLASEAGKEAAERDAAPAAAARPETDAAPPRRRRRGTDEDFYKRVANSLTQSTRIMDNCLYQNYVQAVAHANHLRQSSIGGGKKYRQKGGASEPPLSKDLLTSIGKKIQLLNLTEEQRDNKDNKGKQILNEKLMDLRLMKEKPVINKLKKELETAISKTVGGGTRKNRRNNKSIKNRKSRRNNRNRNKSTKRR